MLPQFSALWDQTTLTRPMRHPNSRDGSLTVQTGTPEDHPPEEEEEDHPRPLQDHLQAEEVEEVGVVEGVEAEEAVEEHFRCLDTHPPRQLKSF